MVSKIQSKAAPITSRPSTVEKKPTEAKPAEAKPATVRQELFRDGMAADRSKAFQKFFNPPSQAGTVQQPLTSTNQTAQATYPPEVTAAVGDVNTYLNGLTPPADIAAQGTNAVNTWKMQQLASELHGHIYNADGTYQSSPPFNDAQAQQTMYSAAAQLSYDALVAEGKDPRGADRQAWNSSWASLAGAGITSTSFGDYGWNPIYQDGSPGQSTHFHLALNGSLHIAEGMGQALGGIPVVGGGLKWLAEGILSNNTMGTFVSQLGNYQHEYQGQGPSKQDAFNSMFAILVSRDLKNGNLDPFSASTLIGQGLQSGEPILSMDFSNPSNYLWAGPALGLPDAAVDRSRYPN